MQLQRAANLCFDSVLALCFPQYCRVCGDSVESRALGAACAKCWQQTRLFDGAETICGKCGLPSLGAAPGGPPEATRCRRCEELAFLAARACGEYGGALRAAVLQLKQQPHLCRKLTEQLGALQRQSPLNRATRIIPVPLHPERERARGFNQAAVIGRELARLSGLPLDEASLQRTTHTIRHRAGMDAKGRRDTVAGAFRVTHPALVLDERILLVDDVFTTGATVSACAQVLLAAGAREVYVLTLARPLRYR